MVLASGIWYGTLTYVAANLIPRLDDVAALVARMNWIGLIVLLVVAGVIATFLVLRWRRRDTKKSQESES